MLNVRIWFFSVLILIPIFCLSAEEDFETLMGKGTDLWKYVETPEDQKRLHFFKEAFNKNFPQLRGVDKTASAKIPKVIHFIWLGPKDFPETSVRKIAKWVELHPDWTFKFWTDIDRDPPMKVMKKQLIEDFSFQFLLDAYDQSDNFGEKAKVLSYEILFREGGVYIDHDVKPCKSLEELNLLLDFYCGLEKLAPSILSSSIYAASHLIGARPNHPIIKETLVWLKERWKKLEEFYPGHTKIALRNRFVHRALWALNEGIERGMGEGFNLIFPASYFSLARNVPSAIALHAHEETWVTAENDFEKKMEGQFQEILNKNNESLCIVLLLSLGILLTLIILFSFVKTMRKSYEI